jgi:hypothetical protein
MKHYLFTSLYIGVDARLQYGWYAFSAMQCYRRLCFLNDKLRPYVETRQIQNCLAIVVKCRTIPRFVSFIAKPRLD